MAKVVGIDMGVEVLRGVVVERRGEHLSLLSAGAMPLGDLGQMDESQDKRLALTEKLKELVQGAQLRAPVRRIATGGKRTDLRYLMVPPVPPWRLEMLATYEVQEKEGDETVSRAFDYRIMDVPEVGGQYTVMIGCADEEHIQWLIDSGKQAKLGDIEVDVEAVALYNAYYHGHGYDENKTALVVDIGAESVTALLIRNGALYLARTFVGGSQRFAQVLADDLSVDQAEAQSILQNEAEIVFNVPTPGTGYTARLPASLRRATITMRRRNQNTGGSDDDGNETPKPGDRSADASKPTIKVKTGPAVAGDDENLELDLPPELRGDQFVASVKPKIKLTGSKPVEPEKAETSDASSGGGLKDDLAATPTEKVSLPGGMLEDPVEAMAAETQKMDAPETSADADAESEQKKQESANKPPLDEEAEKRKQRVSMALVREAAALCAALENTLNHCRGQYKQRDLKVETVYLTGSGSRIKGLEEFIGRRMRAEVEPLKVFNRIDLSPLNPAAADELRKEEHSMAVSVGAALSTLCPGAFSFQLWPTEYKKRKEFWARGAYLYYAASVLLVALGLLWWSPHQKMSVLQYNQDQASAHVSTARSQLSQLTKLAKTHEELLLRSKQIDTNAGSGHYFLRVLHALKDPRRIPPDIYLTQISTRIPEVVLMESSTELAPLEDTMGGALNLGLKVAPKAEAHKPDEAQGSFQSQAKVYIRGFVRGKKEELIYKIIGDRTKKGKAFKPGFRDLLVPYLDEPDHPQNIFKDMELAWHETNDHKMGPYDLMEFVLVGFVEGTREGKKNTPDTPAQVVKEATDRPASTKAKDGAKSDKTEAEKPAAAQPATKQPKVKIAVPEKNAHGGAPAADPVPKKPAAEKVEPQKTKPEKKKPAGGFVMPTQLPEKK